MGGGEIGGGRRKREKKGIMRVTRAFNRKKLEDSRESCNIHNQKEIGGMRESKKAGGGSKKRIVARC